MTIICIKNLSNITRNKLNKVNNNVLNKISNNIGYNINTQHDKIIHNNIFKISHPDVLNKPRLSFQNLSNKTINKLNKINNNIIVLNNICNNIGYYNIRYNNIGYNNNNQYNKYKDIVNKHCIIHNDIIHNDISHTHVLNIEFYKNILNMIDNMIILEYIKVNIIAEKIQVTNYEVTKTLNIGLDVILVYYTVLYPDDDEVDPEKLEKVKLLLENMETNEN